MSNLRRPLGRVETVRVLVSSLLLLARVEWWARRRVSVVDLCGRFGVRFAGFDTEPQAASPLPRRLPAVWWSVEQALRCWPWARDRACLRRCLVLGAQLRDSDPALCLQIVSLEPFRAHAQLEVRGHRLDMGDAGALAVARVTT